VLRFDEVEAHGSFDAAVEAVARAFDLSRHPYFAWLAAPGTTREAWRASQVPFRFAVEAFPQALAAVLARVPGLEERMALAENVATEHGRGRLADSHKHTFIQYLRALGATDDELSAPCPVCVAAFNRSLRDLCLSSDHEQGAAALGVIEHLYVGASAAIARVIVARGWVEPGRQRHYEVHEAMDVEHARDLLDLARPGWKAPRTRAGVAQGLLLGAWHFRRLYDDLLPHDAARG